MDVLGIVGIALALGFVGLLVLARKPAKTLIQNAHQPEHAHQQPSVLVVRVFNRCSNCATEGFVDWGNLVGQGIGRSERPVGVCDVNASKRAAVSSRPREKTVGVVKGPTRVGVLIDRRSAPTGGIVAPRLDASGRTVYPRSE